MNEWGYHIGVFKRIWDIFSFPICVLLLAVFIFKYKAETVVYTVAPVVTINKDGTSVVLLNKNSAQAYRDAAIQTSERVAKVIYGYSNDGQYSTSAAEYSKLFDENTSASRTYRDIIQKNILESKKNTAVFTLDRQKTIAALDPKNSGVMVVILKGYQTITTTSATTSNPVTLNLTMYFNEKRGEDGEIFKISDINFNQ